MSEDGKTFLSAFRDKTPDTQEGPSKDEQAGISQKDQSKQTADTAALSRRYKKASDNFKELSRAIDELTKEGILTPVANEYFGSIKDDFENIDDKVRGFLGILPEINDSIEYMAAIKSIENNIGAAEAHCYDLQIRLGEINRAKENLAREKGAEFSLFAGCDTIEKLKRRYKELSKNYHPDTDSGDKNAMQAINKEYNRLLKIFESETKN